MPIKTPQVVSPLPLPPNPADRSTFNTRAYPWSEALTPWTNEMNQLAADTYDNALDVQGASTVTGSDRDIALGAANAASVDAGLANGYKNEAFASKQSASTSAGLADASRFDAQIAALAAATWATSTTVVSDGNKGAKGYALDAAQSAADAASIVLGEVFDNTQESAVKGWTSSKIVSWFNGLTTAFTRTILGRSNAQQVRDDLQLTYPATAPTVGDGAEVMRAGAYGLGYAKQAMDFSARIDSGFYISAQGSVGMPSGMVPDGGWMINLNWHYNQSGNRYNCSFYGNVQNDFIGFRRIDVYGVPQAPVELYHTGNTLNIGTTAVTARTALNLFADASGVMTNGPGQLSNDMSDFLSSNTFADMGSKIGQYENIQRNAAATGTVSINLALASEFDLTLTGNTTIVFDGSVVPAGKSRSFVVRIRQGATARTLTWPASVTWLVVGPITTPAANKICEYVFSYSAESGWFGRIGASN